MLVIILIGIALLAMLGISGGTVLAIRSRNGSKYKKSLKHIAELEASIWPPEPIDIWKDQGAAKEMYNYVQYDIDQVRGIKGGLTIADWNYPYISMSSAVPFNKIKWEEEC